ncbi:hypothetical protein CDAR_222811 [Caerostris darwini]|uniref:C2H2-type domain-containing protein n=1 Tax=Caerostris darwini TaxID=1538125 RepID=A0AAV4WI98_9ARAC|nr:hypothetical protein CDAR_222811 [Caerostris darwini]
MNKHKINHKENLFYYKDCGRGFKFEQDFERHKLAHTEGRPHACGLFSKAFKSKSDLNTHMLTYSEIRPHVWKFCSKAYKRKQGLKKNVENRCGSLPPNISRTLICRPVPDQM